MQKTTIRLGYCPTRRDVFSREEAMRYGRLVKETLAGHPVELVDLAGINEEELLFRDADVPAVVEKFRAADVDALFFPHCNFGRRTAWPRWHGNSGCRCCCGGRGMTRRTRKACAAGIPSAACSPLARCCAGITSPSLI